MAIEGSKFQAASRATQVAEREGAQRYVERVEAADQQAEMEIEETAVGAGLKEVAGRWRAGGALQARAAGIVGARLQGANGGG